MLFPLFLVSLEAKVSDKQDSSATEYLYPTYLADLYELGFHILLRSYNKSSIPETSSSHWYLMASAPLVLYEKRNDSNSNYGWLPATSWSAIRKPKCFM